MSRRRALATGIPAALVLVALIAWPIYAADQRARVAVVFDSKPVVCSDQTVGIEKQQRWMPVVALSPDLSCTLRFYVDNRGSLPISIDSAAFPYLGKQSGSRVTVLGVDGNTEPLAQSVYDTDDEMGVAYPLNTSAIGPGEERLFTADIRYTGPKCVAGGMTFAVGQMPVLQVSSLALPGTAEPSGAPFVIDGTPLRRCKP